MRAINSLVRLPRSGLRHRPERQAGQEQPDGPADHQSALWTRCSPRTPRTGLAPGCSPVDAIVPSSVPWLPAASTAARAISPMASDQQRQRPPAEVDERPHLLGPCDRGEPAQRLPGVVDDVADPADQSRQRQHRHRAAPVAVCGHPPHCTAPRRRHRTPSPTAVTPTHIAAGSAPRQAAAAIADVIVAETSRFTAPTTISAARVRAYRPTGAASTSSAAPLSSSARVCRTTVRTARIDARDDQRQHQLVGHHRAEIGLGQSGPAQHHSRGVLTG